MQKENNCRCVVCDVERSLLNSLSTQTARTHFQALARNYTSLNRFDSPADVIAQLHDHEHVELVNHKAWNEILHALVSAIADRTGEDIGQQLLLVAYAPAIHKACSNISAQFPHLPHEDVAQQAAVCFLETARSSEMRRLNGQLPRALVNRFRQSLFRWAMRENRQSLPLQQGLVDYDEPAPSNFEQTIMLEKFLQQMVREGLLSEEEHRLLLRFKWEGFEARELAGEDAGSTTNAVQMRLKKIIKRLRQAAKTIDVLATEGAEELAPGQTENLFESNGPFSPGRCAFSNSEKGLSPEPSDRGPQVESDVPPIAA